MEPARVTAAVLWASPSQGSSLAPSPLQWCRFCRRPFGPLSAASHGRQVSAWRRRTSINVRKERRYRRHTGSPKARGPLTPFGSRSAGRLLRRLVAVNADGRAGWGCGAAVKGDLSRFAIRRLGGRRDRKRTAKIPDAANPARHRPGLLRELRAGAIDGGVSALGVNDDASRRASPGRGRPCRFCRRPIERRRVARRAACSVRWVDEHVRMPLWRLPDGYVEDPTEVALQLRDQHSAALGDLRQWRSRRRDRLAAARNRPATGQRRRARAGQRTR